MGQPAPDPFGLSQTFGTGEKLDTSKVPLGAVILIGIGALFLLQTLEVPFFNVEPDLASLSDRDRGLAVCQASGMWQGRVTTAAFALSGSEAWLGRSCWSPWAFCF